ncbi:protein artemis [Chanos chanos]|uniref:Protein artemis n=1 Tax=Chanos chanos TaxID=29144 RepID=A0A6J2V4W0_CHACN|nr:protein artemis [Chanos chanos]
MSSFPGRMREYPTISIDRFDRDNLHARAYFLSHCHKDHMKGLKGPLLKRKLKFSLTVKLYCSFVTKELLLSNPKYAFWEDHIVALELDSPSHISLIDEVTGESEDVVVTLLSAGHCPGSVMFLFEGDQGNVLYTGDFRLGIGDAARMECLHSGNRVKDIKSVYLDTTFYDPRFYQIPSREACLNGIRELVKDWICLSPYHVIWLNCKAAYGYEYLFNNLAQEFNSQIHVNSLGMFRKMPEILCHVTTNRASQIHACRHPKDEEMFRANRLPCGSTATDGTPLRIISIKPSTMWFGERTRKTSVIVRMGESSYRACFSFHSSYSEIKDFLTYIKPVNIYANVIPMGRTIEDVTELLKPMCRKDSEGAEIVYKPLGMLKRSRKHCTLQGSDSEDELFAEVSVVPKRKKTEIKEEVEPQNPEKTPLAEDQSHIPPEPQLSVQATNYMDCTESNDDDDDDEDEESGALTAPKSSGDAPFTAPCSQSATHRPEAAAPSSKSSPPPHTEPALPSWNSFFKVEPALTDESCEMNSSQNSLAHSTDHACSHSPELFHDEDDEDGDGSVHMSSSQSTHISDIGAENCSQPDTVLILSQESKTEQLNGQREMRTNGELESEAHMPADAVEGPRDSSTDQSERVEEAEQKPDSQVSSDFEIPLTPGSRTPKPEELSELYRKIAAGEELVIRRVATNSNTACP